MVNDRQSLDLTTFAQPSGDAVEWRISDAPVPYPEAVAAMEARVAAIAAGEAPELVWLLEHPPLYTSGTSGKSADLLEPRFPVFANRPRRPAHLSRPGPARGLCDARPEAAAAGRARLCGWPRGMDHPHACCLQRARRAARGPRRRLGQTAGQGRRASRTRSRRSACGCGAGCRSTASQSMSSRTCRISRRSCPAASPTPAMA